MRKPAYIYIWLAVFCLITAGTQTWAVDAYMHNLKPSYGDGYLRLSANLEVSFSGKIREIILSGLETMFIFEIRLTRQTNPWLTEKLFHKEITHSVRYDTLKKEYKVVLSEENPSGDKTAKENLTRDFQQMRRWMTDLNNIKTVPTWSIQRGEQYTLEIRSRMRAIDLPFPLDYLNVFIHFEEFETPWVSLPIVYGAYHGQE